MSSLPFISVVVPTRNRLDMLKQTLACLRRQRFPRDQYEVIVVDDGSEDGTPGYLGQLASQGRITYLRQPSRGPAVARNAGARVARGEVVAFTDDDCLPEADWLATLAAAYRTGGSPCRAGVGGHIEYALEGHWLCAFQVVQNLHQMNRAESPPSLDTANASYDRSLFLRTGGFSEEFPCASGEDVDLGFRLVRAGYTLESAPHAVVRHRGRTTVREILRHAFTRGRGNAILMAKYPPALPVRRLPLLGRRWLDRLVRWAGRLPLPIRPLACGIAATLRRAVLDMAGTGEFLRTSHRDQVLRCRALEVGSVHKGLYLLLIWGDYFARLAGQSIQTFQYFYQTACVGQGIVTREKTISHTGGYKG